MTRVVCICSYSYKAGSQGEAVDIFQVSGLKILMYRVVLCTNI